MTANETLGNLAKSLTKPMINALATGHASTNSAPCLGRRATLNALYSRGLIDSDNRWTTQGRYVAALILSGHVYTLDELHEIALSEMRTSLELRAARNAADQRAAADVERDMRRLGLDPRLPDRAALRSKSCCATTEGDVHARDCQTPAARKQWGPASLRTQEERAPEAAPQFSRERIAVSDLVTVDGCGPRVWRVERIISGDRFIGIKSWALLSRHDSLDRRVTTTANLDQLIPAPAKGEQQEKTCELTPGLQERIVKRAKYDALKAVLAVLNGWIDSAQETCEALGHRDERPGSRCGDEFTPTDIRRMVNGAAHLCGTSEPWRAS